jgi:hypothetical protein
MKKRFQEINKIHQLWRYRWYILIPFQVLWYRIVGLKILHHNQDNSKYFFYKERNLKTLISICVGTAQSKMSWYYTSEELFSNLEKRINFNQKQFKNDRTN